MKSTIPGTLLASLGTLIFLFLLLPLFLIWIPAEILSASGHEVRFSIGAFRNSGLLSIASGVVIYIWCACSFVFSGKGSPIPFTPTKHLVVTGLVRFVRNPIYIAGSLVLAGEALLFQSKGLFIYLLIMFGFFNVHVVMEEKLLADKFGTAYELYRRSVPRWIPRLTPYKEKESASHRPGRSSTSSPLSDAKTERSP